MEIYQMADRRKPWDISHMAVRAGKKAESEARARDIYRRLMALDRPIDLSNNDWAKSAGVNTSFFTQLKGNANKAPSEPSIGNLRLVLERAGSSIPEFFIHEAKGRLVVRPSRQEIEKAMRDALSEATLPRSLDTRAAFLAGVVQDILALPPHLPAIGDSEDRKDDDDRAVAVLPHAATK